MSTRFASGYDVIHSTRGWSFFDNLACSIPLYVFRTMTLNPESESFFYTFSSEFSAKFISWARRELNYWPTKSNVPHVTGA